MPYGMVVFRQQRPVAGGKSSRCLALTIQSSLLFQKSGCNTFDTST